MKLERAMQLGMLSLMGVIVTAVIVKTQIDRKEIAQSLSEPLSWPPPADAPLGLDNRLLDPTITVPEEP